MRILLTNDDGIYAPGLAAMESELRKLGEVWVVAPATEQSGVSHSITFLTPLVVREVDLPNRHPGWAVEGSPADCVKLAVTEIMPQPPDLLVSGINGGLNAGINVLYSGTVAAAIEGAFFGITSVAVSLEYGEHPDFESAASMARQVIEGLLDRQHEKARLFNLNVPTVATQRASSLKIVPMGISRYGESYEKRTDPRGRSYYWATTDPPPPATEHETDLSALEKGFLTLTPLHFDLTQHAMLQEMQEWTFDFS